VLSTGAEKMVELDQVDIRRTMVENADLGTQVTLKPRPANSSRRSKLLRQLLYCQAAEHPNFTAHDSVVAKSGPPKPKSQS